MKIEEPIVNETPKKELFYYPTQINYYFIYPEAVVSEKEVKKEEVDKNDYKLTLLLSPGLDIDISPIGNRLELQSIYNVQFDIGISFDNMISLGKNMGLGLQLNLGLDFIPKTNISVLSDIFSLDNYYKSFNAELLANLCYKAKNNMFIVSPGVLTLIRTDIDVNGTQSSSLGGNGVNIGVIAALQYRYSFTKLFSLGIEARYTCLFVKDMLPTHSVGTKLYFGFSL